MPKRPINIVNEIVDRMKLSGLGIPRKSVSLLSHNKQWEKGFVWIKNKICQTLGDDTTYRVEHFGSTSIENIKAKPVLDIMVIFAVESKLTAIISKFESLGFIYKGDAINKIYKKSPDPGRHFFSFYDLNEDVDYIHLHVFLKNHRDIIRNLKFRDKLRSDPSSAKDYEYIKEKLKNAGLDRHTYTRRKTEFISKITNPQSIVVDSK